MKYYFDTSALVKIYHPENGTEDALKLYQGDSHILISDLSRIEFFSTIYRKFREGEINSDILDALALKFQEDIEFRYELLDFSSLVLDDAANFLSKFGKTYSLKTLDSLQFAFFTAYADKDDVFVCADTKLANVVRLAGFEVCFLQDSLPAQKKRLADNSLPPQIFLSPPHMSGEEAKFVQEAFESNYIAPLGPMVDAFEREFAEYIGIKHCVALSSGTAAMHLALRHLGIGPGDNVFASTLTFIGSVTPVLFQGAMPVFIDCDRESWNMDPDLLETELVRYAKEGNLPKAVIPTDLYGQCADCNRIFEICKRYDVPVIVDAAEALGAKYKRTEIRNQMSDYSDQMPTDLRRQTSDLWNHAGVGAKAAIYSFNGNKIITTSGGGMLASNDKELIDHARKLSQQAREDFVHYEHEEIGYNYRMSNILAAIGRGQLKVLDERVKKKRWIFEYYKNALEDITGIAFMPEPQYSRSNRWLTVILITPDEFGSDRETVQLALEKENIESRPVWKPMHMQPVFQVAGRKVQGVGQKSTNTKQTYKARTVGGNVAEDLFKRGLCLPSGTAMTKKELDRVIEVIRKVEKN